MVRIRPNTRRHFTPMPAAAAQASAEGLGIQWQEIIEAAALMEDEVLRLRIRGRG